MLHVIHSDGFKIEQNRQSLRLDTSTSHNASSIDTQRDVLGSRHVTGSLLFGKQLHLHSLPNKSCQVGFW